MLVSERRSDNNNVGPYLVVILLAPTLGYNLFGSKELRLFEVYAVASSKRFARCITRPIFSFERADETNKEMKAAPGNK